MKKILIVEDDELLNKTLAYNLAYDGYGIVSSYTYAAALGQLERKTFDLVLLDINLPDGSGLDLCKEIRERYGDTFIFFLTANDKESDMLKGYEIGGTDYITKPFSVVVLSRKLKVFFANLEKHTPQRKIYNDGHLRIDFSEQSASLDGKPVDFTPKEYRTLYLFVKNPRMILTKRQLLEKLWDVEENYVDEHTLTTIISRIRGKIKRSEHKYIKTAYGMGYQWMGGGKQ
jgi:DNA-binding response OmpR family regulator